MNSEQLSFTYNTQTLLSKVSINLAGGADCISGITYNALGQPLVMTLGNGA